jgi:hypothetical protein
MVPIAVPPPGQNVGGKVQYFAQPPFQQQQPQQLPPQVKSEPHINTKKINRAVKIVDPVTRKPINDVKANLNENGEASAQNATKLNTHCNEFYPERQKKASIDESPPKTDNLTPQESANKKSE